MFLSYILTTAIRPQPWLAAALTAIGTLMGRNYRTVSNLRSNLYVIGLAASGGGKDHARNVIKEAFLAADLAAHLGGNRLASGAGLLAALYRQPASLFQIDEFGQFLASIIDKRRAPKHLAEIWDLFTELSTSAGSTFFGAEYADQKLNPRQDIIQPCCAIHATTARHLLDRAPHRLAAGRQPRALPHLPQHRRHSRPQPHRGAARRRAGRPGRGAPVGGRRRAEGGTRQSRRHRRAHSPTGSV